MSNFRILSIDDLIKELEKYTFKQFHTHHTWKPAHSSFNGKNHIQIQQSMKEHHIKANGWSDIGQHITLMPDGTFITGRPFNITPASIAGWNTGSLALEMIGNFDKPNSLPINNLGYDKLEGIQKEVLLKLLNWFGNKYGFDKIKFHREGPGVFKSCPGNSIDKETLINEAKAYKEKSIVKVKIKGNLKELEGYIKNGTTYIIVDELEVPLRKAAELLGYKVGWDNVNQIILLD